MSRKSHSRRLRQQSSSRKDTDSRHHSPITYNTTESDRSHLQSIPHAFTGEQSQCSLPSSTPQTTFYTHQYQILNVYPQSLDFDIDLNVPSQNEPHPSPTNNSLLAGWTTTSRPWSYINLNIYNTVHDSIFDKDLSLGPSSAALDITTAAREIAPPQCAHTGEYSTPRYFTARDLKEMDRVKGSMSGLDMWERQGGRDGVWNGLGFVRRQAETDRERYE